MKSLLPDWKVANKTVLLRIDGNVPLQKGTITNDFRLKKLQSTFNLLRAQKACVTIATHIGRPSSAQPELSTQHLLTWFTNNGYETVFARTLEEAQRLRKKYAPEIFVLLENLRFFPGEKLPDPTFAQALAQLGDYYVNDAFAMLHRNDTSVALVPKLYKPDKKSFGLLVEHELRELEQIAHSPKKPFVVIVGGKKIEDKINLLLAMFKRADIVCILPALANTFLHTQGATVGRSLIDITAHDKIAALLEQNIDKVYLPDDYLIEHPGPPEKLMHTTPYKIPHDSAIMSFGTQTLKKLELFINKARTIFFNGAPGFLEQPKTRKETNELLHLIARSTAHTVIGGGDTIAAAAECKLLNSFSFVSTGGGATLALLAGEPLPGIVAMQLGRN